MDFVVAGAVQRQQLGAQVGGECARARARATLQRVPSRRRRSRPATPSTPSSEVPDIRPMKMRLIAERVWDAAVEAGVRPRCMARRRADRLFAEQGAGAAASRRRRAARERSAPAGRTAPWPRARRTAASDFCATSSGSCCWPSTLTSKCRCGPVAQPVWPTAPMVAPCSTCWPLRDVDAAQVGVDASSARCCA